MKLKDIAISALVGVGLFVAYVLVSGAPVCR